MINRFDGEHRWLSNFYVLETPIISIIDGLIYPTVEHFYVANKTLNMSHRIEIAQMIQPGSVKRFGRTVELRHDWDDIKLEVMKTALIFKFSSMNPTLRSLLVATGNVKLQEGNWWKDRYWGVCLSTGEGQNHLGRLLMEIRSEIIQGLR